VRGDAREMEGGGLLELEGAELLVDHLPYYLVGCHCEWWWSCGRKLAMVELVVVVEREFLSGNQVALAWLLDGPRRHNGASVLTHHSALVIAIGD
jgi:hypothetical protein